MLQILSHPVFLRLFSAQVVALLATGFLTIALGLLAFELAGAQAGKVLGLALTIKMLAYVLVSPLMAALLQGAGRRAVLIGADLVRAGAALALPFISEAWQIYVAIFFLQAASATFTPAFQALIPDVLEAEEDYTRALSLSRLAYDLESLLSPALAALLLAVLAPSGLFMLTALGFVGSAFLVSSTSLPPRRASKDQPFRERLARGSRIYFATPRLRGLFALSVCVAAVAAVVIVQSVVLAQGVYRGTERDLAVLLGAYGLGSMLVALALPRLLEQVPDRAEMLFSGAALALGGMGVGVWVMVWSWPSWGALLAIWFVLGAANAGVLTPAGRLLRRSAHAEDRPAIFVAQFALSHAAFLVAYPLAGTLGASLGVEWAFLLLGLLAVAAGLAGALVWPAGTPEALEHSHEDLPPDHPHLQGAVRRGGRWVHAHRFVIDDEHRVWPTSG